MSQWVSVGKYGIRYREHKNKTVGVGRSKRPLRYYTAVYKHQGKVRTDSYGWEGIDFHNEDHVVTTAIMLRQNRRDKTPPFTLKELLVDRQRELNEIEENKRLEQEHAERDEQTKLDKVFDDYCLNNAHKKSLIDEKSYYRNWIKKPLGQKRLDQITLFDLERIRKRMAKAKRAPRSIQYIKSIIRQTYNYAVEHGLYAGNIPTTHFLKKQKIDNKRQKHLDPIEASALLDEIRRHSEKTYQVCLLSLNTGMRFGEIASLLWQHINIERREILIIAPKNAESRGVYMTDAVLQMFREMEEKKPANLVFPSRKGGKMNSISKVFSRSVDILGINEGITDRRMKVVFHTLRHSCASWLVNLGVGLPIIAKILGHKSLAMTMRYSHVNDISVQNAMRMLDQQQQKKEKLVEINSG